MSADKIGHQMADKMIADTTSIIRDLDEAYDIIAILVTKLGGSVTITESEIVNKPPTPVKRIDLVSRTVFISNKQEDIINYDSKS